MDQSFPVFSTYSGAVMTWECDSNRHMNVMYYVNKFEHGGRILFSKLGLGRPWLEARGLGIAVVEQVFQYKREVFEDDILNVVSRVKSYGGKIVEVRHEMTQADAGYLSATVDIKLVFLDLKRRKAVPLSDEIIQKLQG